MGGIHKISSSAFIQSGSIANFKSGISSSNLTITGAIFAQGFQNLGITTITNTPLTVGTQSIDGSFRECVTSVNKNFRLTAAGNFNHFTFIEKRNNGWFQISSGSQKGQVKKNFVDIEGKPSPGVYEYLVLGVSTSSLETIAKGTTVKVIP
tara:strand:- start:203 stop:655 length:453 start_codon:yes stop_codon:yes gene_type:complete